ncbi:unnamed protein product [Ascophyllum nodosum]
MRSMWTQNQDVAALDSAAAGGSIVQVDTLPHGVRHKYNCGELGSSDVGSPVDECLDAPEALAAGERAIHHVADISRAPSLLVVVGKSRRQNM